MKAREFAVFMAVCALAFGCEQNTDTASNQGESERDRSAESSGTAAQGAAADRSSSAAATAEAEPNNTAVNQRDRDGALPTPEDQGGSEADREMTRQIRKAVIDHDQLSFDAKNVKIITQDGKVTLRGVVASEQEKNTIEQLARGVVKTGTLDNQLEVKTTNQNQ